MENFTETRDLWFKFNHSANELTAKLRTRNIVGEYAERLAVEYYGGKLLPISKSSADLKGSNGKLYQVKARQSARITSAQLGVIRSWDFEYLVVFLFDIDGKVVKAIESPVETAKFHAKPNKYQNGWVITTNQAFLSDTNNVDITSNIVAINDSI